MRISLIGTYHAELGAVTVPALLAILERIQPEVVFAEIPRTCVEGRLPWNSRVNRCRALRRHPLD